MEIQKLHTPRIDRFEAGSEQKFIIFQKLLFELRHKRLLNNTITFINLKIEKLNELIDAEEDFSDQITKSQGEILKHLAEKLKIVPKNHYRNLWMALGTGAFGLPFGLIVGASLDNFAFIGIGLPFGLLFGVALGTRLDQKAEEEGRQLEWDNDQ